MKCATRLVLLVFATFGTCGIGASAASAVTVTPSGVITGTSSDVVFDGDIGLFVVMCTSSIFTGTINSAGAGTIVTLTFSSCKKSTGENCSVSVTETTGTFTVTSTTASTLTGDGSLTGNLTCSGATFTLNWDTTVFGLVTDNTAGVSGSGLTFATNVTSPWFTNLLWVATYRVKGPSGATLTVT
jgi:hypothetical protein